jgi:membrane associated rhomboid family serine protease
VPKTSERAAAAHPCMDLLRRLPLPPATKLLLVVNVAVFAVNALLLGALSEPQHGAWFAFSWPALLDGYGLGLLRVLTYQFTHAFDSPQHLLFNMLALWVFAPIAESRLGRIGTVRLYLWAGLAGAVGHLAVASVQGLTAVPLVGASGACYGMMLYAACVAPQMRIVFVIVQMPLWGLAALLTALGAYSMFVELATGYGGGVAHSAHLGGALLGLAAHRLGLFVGHGDHAGAATPGRTGTFARVAASWRQRRAAAVRRRADAYELELDAILAKVKADGLSALTAAERRFLEQQSTRARRGS